MTRPLKKKIKKKRKRERERAYSFWRGAH